MEAMACPAAKSAVVIPAVRKGLCNQRVRMVQDIMLAHLFGAPAGIKSAAQACAPDTQTPIFMWDRGHKVRTWRRSPVCSRQLSRHSHGGIHCGRCPPTCAPHTVPYL